MVEVPNIFKDVFTVKTFGHDSSRTNYRVLEEDPNVGKESCRTTCFWDCLRVVDPSVKGK